MQLFSTQNPAEHNLTYTSIIYEQPFIPPHSVNTPFTKQVQFILVVPVTESLVNTTIGSLQKSYIYIYILHLDTDYIHSLSYLLFFQEFLYIFFYLASIAFNGVQVFVVIVFYSRRGLSVKLHLTTDVKDLMTSLLLLRHQY